MKRFVKILAEILLIVAAGVMVFFAAAIYDTQKKLTIVPYFFQPNSFSDERIGQPLTAAQMGDDNIRDMLLQRFVTEYFYVIPDATNVATRVSVNRLVNPFARMQSDDVFNAWLENVAPEIQEMADDGKLRLVRFHNEMPNHGITYDAEMEYWQITFDLYTWDAPNNLGALPMVEEHVMFLQFTIDDKKLPTTIREKGIHKYLDDGGDPTSLFYITVTKVIVK